MPAPLNSPDAVRLHCERAEALIEVRRYTEALSELSWAAAAAPDFYRTHALASLALLEMARLDEALAAADHAVSLQPDEEWGHRLRANILLAQGHPFHARKAAREAVRLDPQGYQAIHTLAWCNYVMRDFKTARIVAENLRSLYPDAADVHELLGQVALAQKRIPNAEEHFRHALKLDPQSPTCLAGLAEVMKRSRRRGASIAWLRRAVRLQPADPDYRTQFRDELNGYLLDGVRGFDGFLILLFLFLGLIAADYGLVYHARQSVPEPHVNALAAFCFVLLPSTYHLVRWRRLKAIDPESARLYREERAQRRRAWLLDLPLGVWGFFFALAAVVRLFQQQQSFFDPRKELGMNLTMVLVAAGLFAAEVYWKRWLENR